MSQIPPPCVLDTLSTQQQTQHGFFQDGHGEKQRWQGTRKTYDKKYQIVLESFWDNFRVSKELKEVEIYFKTIQRFQNRFGKKRNCFEQF